MIDWPFWRWLWLFWKLEYSGGDSIHFDGRSGYSGGPITFFPLLGIRGLKLLSATVCQLLVILLSLSEKCEFKITKCILCVQLFKVD